MKELVSRLLETELSKKTTGVKIFQFLFPWVVWAILAGSSALVFYIIQNWESARNLLYVWWFYMIPPMGKEVIIPRTLSQDHHPPALVVALATSGVDMVLSLFMIWNYDWVKKVPLLGPRIKEAEARGKDKIRKTKWFSKVSFIATAMFVSVPFSGAGGWFGTVFGRLIGVKPYKVLLAVFIGSTIEAFGYALLADSLMPYLEDSSFFEWLSNLNILQVFAAFGALALIIYVVRHPREAVKKTSSAVRKTIRLSEDAVIRAEDLSRKGLTFSVKRSGDSLDLLEGVYGEVLEGLPHLAGGRLRILDRDNREIVSSLEKTGIEVLKETGSLTSKTLKGGVRSTGEGFDRTARVLSKATVIGLDVAKEGVDKGEYLVLMVGGEVEKVIKVPSSILKRMKR
jgi:uncharacterized membrane protein